MTKNFLIGLAKYGLGFGLLAYVLWQNWAPAPDGSSPGLSGIFQRPIQLGPLLAAFVICLFSILLTFFRWYLLVRAQHLDLTLFDSFRLGLIGYFLSNFLPGSVTGDVFKAAFLARQQSRRTVAVATVMVDRAIGLWALFWLVALVGCAYWLLEPQALAKPVLQKAVVIASTLVAVSTVGWIVWTLLPARAERVADWLHGFGRIGAFLAEIWRAMWMYRRQWRWIVVALLLSIVGHIGFVLTFYFAAHTFADPAAPDQFPTLAEHFLIVPAGMAFQALFPAPGGVGGAEVAYGQLYKLVLDTDAARDNGIAGSLTQRLITWVLSLIGYIVYLRTKAQMPHVVEVVPAADEQPVPEPTDEVPAALR